MERLLAVLARKQFDRCLSVRMLPGGHVVAGHMDAQCGREWATAGCNQCSGVIIGREGRRPGLVPSTGNCRVHTPDSYGTFGKPARAFKEGKMKLSKELRSYARQLIHAATLLDRMNGSRNSTRRGGARKISAIGRRRIAQAQKRRWAKIHAKKAA